MAKNQRGGRLERKPPELKAAAVKRLLAGESVETVARDTRLSSGTLYSWKSQAKKKLVKQAGRAIVRAEYMPASSGASEANELRREVELLKQENEILTQTIMVFARRRG